MLMSMLMSHASVDFSVLSFVLPCAYAYVASENQAISCLVLEIFRFFEKCKLDVSDVIYSRIIDYIYKMVCKKQAEFLT